MVYVGVFCYLFVGVFLFVLFVIFFSPKFRKFEVLAVIKKPLQSEPAIHLVPAQHRGHIPSCWEPVWLQQCWFLLAAAGTDSGFYIRPVVEHGAAALRS